MNKLLLFWLVIILPTPFLFAERIDGPANVRDKPNGKALFSLNDSVKVICNSFENGWYHIGVYVYFPAKSLQQQTLAKGTVLLDKNGNEIGHLLSSMELNYHEPDPSGETWGTYLTAYTYKGNIRPDSFQEYQIEQLLNSPEYLKISDFNAFLAEHEGQQDEDWEDGIKTFTTLENWYSDRERVRLLFENNTLVAIFHLRPIDSNNYFQESFKLNNVNVHLSYPKYLSLFKKDAYKQAYMEKLKGEF